MGSTEHSLNFIRHVVERDFPKAKPSNEILLERSLLNLCCVNVSLVEDSGIYSWSMTRPAMVIRQTYTPNEVTIMFRSKMWWVALLFLLKEG